MIWHRCDLKLPSLFGPTCCGREATTYDRARKAWLCPEHTKERLSSANTTGPGCGFVIRSTP